MSLALELARRATALDTGALPPDTFRWAKDAIADMIGCALLGAPTATTTRAIASGMDAPGPALVLGRRLRLGLLEAAFVNATSGHALDYDDTSKSMSGHPTVIIVPAILGLAETRGATGAQFLDAYVTGVELATRFARGVNFFHYEKGWHPTATLGIFGATAAAARLLGLDAERTAHALAMAASLAAGVKANFGTETKPVHAGLTARNALYAALMAEGGTTASPVAFEHPQGFLEVLNGKGNYDIDRMLPDWGNPPDLLSPGISIKKYPCVYSVHGAVDAAIILHDRDRPASADIAGVTVRMHRRRMLPHVQNPATSALNAKFSLPYAVARGLVDGAVSLEHFEDGALHDPEITRIMGLVRMEPHSDDANDYGGEVEVELASGRRLRAAVASPLGRGPEAPLKPGMLRAKFTDCAGRSLSADGAQAIFGRLMALEAEPSIRSLCQAVEAATLKSKD